MFNLLPGAGLGFTGSKLIAVGLAPVGPITIPPVTPPSKKPRKSYTGGGMYSHMNILDNQYSIHPQDNEIVEICTILCMGLE